jgi:hypothetical protein
VRSTRCLTVLLAFAAALVLVPVPAGRRRSDLECPCLRERLGDHPNPADLFREAENHGELSPSYWLTGIDAGFELVSGGLHDNIHYYSLTGVTR